MRYLLAFLLLFFGVVESAEPPDLRVNPRPPVAIATVQPEPPPPEAKKEPENLKLRFGVPDEKKKTRKNVNPYSPKTGADSSPGGLGVSIGF